MCEVCDQRRREIWDDILRFVHGDPESELVQALERSLDEAVKQVTETRIDPVLENDPERRRPTDDEIRNSVRDALSASILALAAAALAQATPSYTDEGGEQASFILGMWAGEVMQKEMQAQVEPMLHTLRHALGMGDN